ncbi:MAG TPA: 3-isopropylmalate dehydrogenase [bacterium]
MKKKIVVLPGDGIGVEVTAAAIKVLKEVAKEFNLSIETAYFEVGGASLDIYDVPIRDEVIAACKRADAVFLGAVGGPKWDTYPKDKRPEGALLKLRKELQVFTNLRPIKVYEPLIGASSLKPEYIQDADILVVRELTGGIYFGKPSFTETLDAEERAVDTMEYRTSEIERIARVAFKAARKRKRKVTSVDKANVLATSQLWRKTVSAVAKAYPQIRLEHMLVDNCAMQLIRNPKQFDVILTENMFGDILSDEAAMLTGSLGMLPSASLGEGVGLYEPVHGSAPDIAGQNIANPIAAISSIALMYRYSFNMEEAAELIERGIQGVLNAGRKSFDLATNGAKPLGTTEMTDEIIHEMNSLFLPFI